MTENELVLLGQCHRDERDYKESYMYFLEAALMDNPDGIKNLAMAYLYGEGVRQNFEKAFRYLRMSYELSGETSLIWHVMAVHDEVVNDKKGRALYTKFIEYLIEMQEWDMYIVQAGEYSKGGAYSYDVKKKIECYENAIAHGIYVGADCLGEMFFLGEEVEKDYKKAYEYFRSYDGYQSFAKPYYLGRMHSVGYYVKRDPERAICEYKSIVDADIPMKGGDVFYIEAESYMRIAKMILEARREILAMSR